MSSKVTVEARGEVDVVQIIGKIMRQEHEMMTEIERMLSDLSAKKRFKIVIDFSRVIWLDSTGLGLIMGWMTMARNGKGDVKLTGITENVENLFVVTKLVTIFDTFDSLEEAVAAFQK